MDENKNIEIGGRLHSIATGNVVAGADEIFDDAQNKKQSIVNTEVQSQITQLGNTVDALQKQDIVPVDALPEVATADPKKIYRVTGSTSYIDYMVNAEGTDWKELATFAFPGIDDEPTAWSDNPVKSGGVAATFYKEIGNIIIGKAINNLGNEVDAGGYLCTSRIKVSPGDTVGYKSGASTTIDYCLVVYKADGTKITDARGTTAERSVKVSTGAAYCRATFVEGGNYDVTVNGESRIYQSIKVDIRRLNNDLNITQLSNINLIDTINVTKLGNVYNGIGVDGTTGIIYEDNTLKSALLIPALESQEVKYLAGYSISPASLVVYDYRGIRISNIVGTSSVRTLTLPANTAYIAASFKKDTDYSLTINRNDGQGDVNVLVEDKISDIGKSVEKNAEIIDSISSNIIIGKAIYSDGSIITDSDMIATEKIVCKEGDVIAYIGGSSILSTKQYSLVAYDSLDEVRNYWRGMESAREITIPNNTAYIRATFAIDTDFALTINGSDVIFNKSLNRILLKDAEQDKKIEQLNPDIFDRMHLMPINVFGDIIPPIFKEKYMNMENDLLIVCQGDSLTGLIERCDIQEEPEHCPPGCQYKSWIYLLQQNLSKKKPVCDRVDSLRDGIDVFTKSGTWENVVTIRREEIYASDGTTFGQQRTVSALTFQCADDNASLSFVFDADIYEKCNIVYSKEPDGVLTKIIISEGDGKMLVSDDRETWVEANNFQCNQRTFAEVIEGNGNANREPHRRLWMKKANSSVGGTINITYQRDNSTQYSDSYMYVWGIEKWSDCAIFIDNLGRGGRTTKILKANISDIFDRHPDLAIYEMPLANEISRTGTPMKMTTLKSAEYYEGYFLGNGNDSFKTRSNNYTELPLIVVLPHGRANYFDDDNNAVRLPDSPDGEPNVYTCSKRMYSWLKSLLNTYTNVSFINLYDVLINEALVLDNIIKRGFSGADKCITGDGVENSVHLSQYGAFLWAKYLSGIFNV